MWLASLGKERINETFDPSIAMQRAIELYRKKVIMKNGYQKELKHFKKEKNLQMYRKKMV